MRLSYFTDNSTLLAKKSTHCTNKGTGVTVTPKSSVKWLCLLDTPKNMKADYRRGVPRERMQKLHNGCRCAEPQPRTQALPCTHAITSRMLTLWASGIKPVCNNQILAWNDSLIWFNSLRTIYMNSRSFIASILSEV